MYNLKFVNKSGQVVNIDGINQPISNANKPFLIGRTLRWISPNSSGNYSYTQLVHKGAVGGSGLAIRGENGVDYEPLKTTSYGEVQRTYSSARQVRHYDDCGNEYSFNLSYGIDKLGGAEQGLRADLQHTNSMDGDLSIDKTLPLTIDTMVKVNSSASVAAKELCLFQFCDKNKKTLTTSLIYSSSNDVRNGCNLIYGHLYQGVLRLLNYSVFPEVQTAAYNFSDWVPVTIHLNPTGQTVYNSSKKADVLDVNCSITVGSDIVTGKFCYNDDGSNSMTAAHFSIGVDANPSPFQYKYFSMSQDTQGYSLYRRSTHLVLLHFE